MNKKDECRGLIQCYTGTGKGKTTAAVGLAVRFAGSGGRVLFTQFLKDGSSSEIGILESIPGIEVFSLQGKVSFSFRMTEEQKQEAFRRNTAYLREIIRRTAEGGYGLLVMDEAAEACHLKLLDAEVLCDFLKKKPASLEVAITGREAGDDLRELADYITEVRKVRHPYDEGIRARKGVEY